MNVNVTLKAHAALVDPLDQHPYSAFNRRALIRAAILREVGMSEDWWKEAQHSVQTRHDRAGYPRLPMAEPPIRTITTEVEAALVPLIATLDDARIDRGLVDLLDSIDTGQSIQFIATPRELADTYV